MNRILVIFFCFVITCCVQQEKDTQGDFLVDIQHLEQRLDSLFNSHFEKGGPGLAILVSYNGKKLINKGYGLRDIAADQPVTPTTNMRSGSLAKQFTALGILSLVEQGKLSLEDTVFQFFPFPVFRNVTIRQLISHTSGIEDAEYMLEKTWDSERYVELGDVIEWYSNNNVSRFKPGTKFEYNNAGYYLLVGIVEMISEVPFREYMKQIVFDKLGMDRTQYIDAANLLDIPERALCYEKDSLGNWYAVETHFLNTLVGAGGLYTNLNDYHKYIEALRKRQILSNESHDLIFSPISMDIELHSEDMRSLRNKESSYAMGWEVTDSLAVSAGLYFGVNNWVIYEFYRPLTIVIFSNSSILFEERLVDKTYQIVSECLMPKTQ